MTAGTLRGRTGRRFGWTRARRRGWRSRVGDERGLLSLELLGLLPLLVVTAMVVLQVGAVLQATLATDAAARAGARAQARGETGDLAARRALPAWLLDHVQVTPQGPDALSVEVVVPTVLPVLPDVVRVRRTAAVPPLPSPDGASGGSADGSAGGAAGGGAGRGAA
ncbi:MAG: hypothetical protein ACTHOD_04340 [Motilibacteraceae bacterium]